jgi:hypothetical protein
VDIEQQIVDLGYQIVAIAQMIIESKKPRRKIKSNTKYFLCKKMVLYQAIGIAFQTPSAIKGYVEIKVKGKLHLFYLSLQY